MERAGASGASPAPLRRIVLTGFMGSGKTTVGGLLAARLGWTFTDLDNEVAGFCGLSVPEIFARHGEAYFRRQESLALAGCLARSALVLALGGGAPETEENRALLRETPGTAVVYLSGAFETLHARCKTQAGLPGAVARPVLADPELALQRFHKRAPFYTEIATVTFDTGSRSPEDVAAQLASAFAPGFGFPEPQSQTA